MTEEQELDDVPPSCSRCGSSASFEDCDECGGEGFIEDDDPDYEPELVRCPNCSGHGGWWRCISGYEWCQAHPLPRREKVTRLS